MSASGHTNSTTTAMYTPAARSHFYVNATAWVFLRAPRTAMRYSEFLAMAAAIGDLRREIPWALEELRQPKLSDGLNKCAKDKTDNSYTVNISCGSASLYSGMFFKSLMRFQ